MWLGALSNRSDRETLCQDFTVPTGLVSARLSFYYLLSAYDNSEPAGDRDEFSVRITDRNDEVIAEAALMTNADDNTVGKASLPWPDRYDWYSYDLHKPQELRAIDEAQGRLRICFELVTNESGHLAVFLDNVGLQTCR